MNAPDNQLNISKGVVPKTFLKPQYDGHCISNIPETVARILHVRSGRPIEDDRLSPYSEAENVVLLVLDGFGTNQLKFARENFGVDSYDQTFSDSLCVPITSVFPSTTSSAMSSLHTGLTPQEHGVVGYSMFVSELGTIGQMLRFVPILGGRSLFDSGLDSRTFLDSKTIHERLTEEGISSIAYVPNYIIDSGLSRITYRGAEIEPSFSFGDTLIRTRRNLEKSKGNSFHFVYHASPDTVSHARGPYSEEFATELESIFRLVSKQLFAKLDKQVARKTTLLISGDHGAVKVNRNSILDVADHSELVSLLRMPPTGDSRASILNIRPDAKEKVLAFFEMNYPEQFEIFDSLKLLSEGYFGLGDVKEEVFNRIGDLVVVPKFDNAIDNSQIGSRNGEIPGRHGGLSEEEMQVPLIATKLAS
ncbi:MAG TPA: alkaline phosphatase family protein [Nitrososphaerales archaeon]|nr:alkaline phosphatase family protein [Nitrososphaerales archaeon]